jgi:hypothetical protein
MKIAALLLFCAIALLIVALPFSVSMSAVEVQPSEIQANWVLALCGGISVAVSLRSLQRTWDQRWQKHLVLAVLFLAEVACSLVMGMARFAHDNEPWVTPAEVQQHQALMNNLMLGSLSVLFVLLALSWRVGVARPNGLSSTPPGHA